jgi:hypothetical protein
MGSDTVAGHFGGFLALPLTKLLAFFKRYIGDPN